MSSSEGLERLKNWQRAEKALVLPSVSWKGTTRIFEVRVRVAFVNEFALVLIDLDAPGASETIDLREAAFASTDEFTADLEVTLATGKKVYLREEE
jgi:hypothetical protein